MRVLDKPRPRPIVYAIEFNHEELEYIVSRLSTIHKEGDPVSSPALDKLALYLGLKKLLRDEEWRRVSE